MASLGAGLEYYDFVIFPLLAPYLDRAFFPPNQGSLGLLRHFGLFAVGYLARPLGGMLFAAQGDRTGRSRAFLASSLLMALATGGIGCLPTYAQVGDWAPWLLITLRCAQGASLGGELPGAIALVASAQATPASQQGRRCGQVMSGVSIGSLLAALLLSVLPSTLGLPTMQRWGWRLPFWLGALMALITYLGRRALPPLDQPRPAKGSRPLPLPLLQLLQHHRPALARGSLLALFGALMVMVPLLLPYARRDAQPIALERASCAGLAWAALACLGLGRLADRLGPRRQVAAAASLTLISLPLLLASLRTDEGPRLWLALFAWQTLNAAVVSGYLPLLAGLFPSAVRCSGIALCYNGAFMLASLVPVYSGGSLNGLALPYALAAAAACLACLPWPPWARDATICHPEL